MKNINKTLWIGLCINLCIVAIFFVSSYYLNARRDELDYDLWSLSKKLNSLKDIILVIVILQVLNVFLVVKVTWISFFTSFVTAFLLLPFSVVYYIGCLLSIRSVELSGFRQWKGQCDENSSTVQYPAKKYLNRAAISFFISGLSVMFLPVLSAIPIVYFAFSVVYFVRAEKHVFSSPQNDGFIITPTLLSPSVFIPYEEINDVVSTEFGVIIETDKGMLKLKNSVVDKKDFDWTVTKLMSVVKNKQKNMVSL